MMNVSMEQAPIQTTNAPRSLSWKCGQIQMGGDRSGGIRAGGLVDWSRQGLDYSTALEQVRIIVASSENALDAIISMVHQLVSEVDDLFDLADLEVSSMERIDILLEQVVAIVSEASLGDINLLGKGSGLLNLPYLMTEIKNGEDYHSFTTMGLGISDVRERSSEANAEALVGIYVLTTDEDESVCWLGSPVFTVKMWDEQETIGANDMKSELQEFKVKLLQFENQLRASRDQFAQYIKMVGETITDPVLNS